MFKIDNSKSDESVRVTILGRDYESCLDLFDRNPAIFTLIFEISATISNDWQMMQEVSEAFWRPVTNNGPSEQSPP